MDLARYPPQPTHLGHPHVRTSKTPSPHRLFLLRSSRAKLAELWVPADVGMNLPWTPEGTVGVLDDWLGHTGGAIKMDRRFFLAVSGGALTAPAWAYADQLATRGGSFAALASSGRTMTVTSAMVDTVAATTAGIRNLGNCNAVFHVGWLSRAHIAAGNLERAVPAAQVALRRLPTVRSRRCELVLRQLEADLAALPAARRPASVRSLQDQLRATHAA